jgi:hypothetical protein
MPQLEKLRIQKKDNLIAYLDQLRKDRNCLNLSGDPYKVREYKIYNNKLNKVKSIAQKNYFEQQFAINKNNIKTTWELIGMIINRDKKKNIDIPKLIYNNKCYVD